VTGTANTTFILRSRDAAEDKGFCRVEIVVELGGDQHLKFNLERQKQAHFYLLAVGDEAENQYNVRMTARLKG
jgi:hypothetical protein